MFLMIQGHFSLQIIPLGPNLLETELVTELIRLIELARNVLAFSSLICEGL